MSPRKFGRLPQLRKGATVCALLLLPLVSACSSAGGGRSAPIDPPPSYIENAMLQEAEGTLGTGDAGAGIVRDTESAATPGTNSADSSELPVVAEPDEDAAEGSGAEDSVTVYLEHRNGYLAPMTLRLDPGDHAASESIQAAAETALSWLTNDPARAEQLPEGFAAVLPEGAKIDSVRLDTETGTAFVNFAELPQVPAAKERKLLESIVWSLTELPGIDKVKLTAAGKPVRSMPVSRLPVDEVLTRGIGINVEKPKGVSLLNSMGVTLYFSTYADDGNAHWVPVTRLVGRSSDRVQTALNELLKGPSDTLMFQDVFLPGLTVDELTFTGDTVQVSLTKADWTPDEHVPADMMEALVLTLTEAAGVPQVKVAMNGMDSFQDTDRRAYDRPVTRPVTVNLAAPKTAP